MIKRRATRLWKALVIACLLTACTPELAQPLRIGTNIWPGYEPLYLAGELGYFGKDSVRLVEYTSSSEVMRAFRNNAIDAAGLTLDEALQLASLGADLKIVLVMDISSGADVILSRQGVKSIKDLKGKRIGAETNALGAYMLTRALEIAGLSSSEVTVVSLEISEHEHAFKEGMVDAVVTFEPVKSDLLAAGARNIFDSSRIPGEILDVLVIRSGALKQGDVRVRSILRGWFRALEYMSKNQRPAAEIMAKREGVSADRLLSSFGGLRFPSLEENRAMLDNGPSVLRASAERLAAVMAERKLISSIPDINVLFAAQYLKEGAL